MNAHCLAEYTLGDILLRYTKPRPESKVVGMTLLPAHAAARLEKKRKFLADPAFDHQPPGFEPVRSWEVDPLVHLHRMDDPAASGYASGRTLRNSPSTQALSVLSHELFREETAARILTQLTDWRGLSVLHELTHCSGTSALRVRVKVKNNGPAPILIGLLTSFSLGGITPFAADDAPGRLWVHRFRSGWSAEGRLVSQQIEDLGLEPSWGGHAVRVERFGQTGSMPLNGWAPLVGIEDRVAGVTWAANLAHPGSWQMEIYRRFDDVAMSGGLADAEFGHWVASLPPGGEMEAPTALVTVVAGGMDEACQRLVGHRRHEAIFPIPPTEAEGLPSVFNEWCLSWGRPTHENVTALAASLRGLGVRYLVIDDGWALKPNPGFQQNGDWLVDEGAFPGGLKPTADAIRANGMVPGLWFEFEVINRGAKAWDETSHQLWRDGKPLEVGNRRFWDFRDPWVHEYLAQKVIDRLREGGFGYLKVDYNDTIGIGCDGSGSAGEGLRLHLQGVQEFFRRIRRELPDLVIENCSSGGYRSEPSMVALTSLTSFSDAFETVEAPIIAANMLRMVPAEKNLVWAVVHPEDSPERLCFVLSTAFLGRLCLSGNITALDVPRCELVRQAIERHASAARVIVGGRWRRFGSTGPSYRHPQGWQAVVFESQRGTDALVVWHQFGEVPEPAKIELPFPVASVDWTFGAGTSSCHLRGRTLQLQLPGAKSGGVMFFSKSP